MANRLGKNQKKAAIKQNWLSKEFRPIYSFMSERFRSYPERKGSIQYNDPWLEMLRSFHRWKLTDEGKHPFPEDD